MTGRIEPLVQQLSAEEALHESELRFRSVVEAANDAVILTDSTGRILSVNQATERIFGYGSELLGQPITVLMPERYRKFHETSFARVNQTGVSRLIGRTVEMHGLRKDGGEFPLELTLASWKIGNKCFYCGTIHDITRRERAESEVLRKTEQVQLLQDVAVASNEATTVEQAIQFAVDRICGHTRWPVGHVYFPANVPDKLAPSTIWHVDDAGKYRDFRMLTQETLLEKGVGLPGRVLARRDAVWVSDVVHDANFPRAGVARDIGIKSGFAFPVLVDSEIVAVLEFFSSDVAAPDEQLLDMMRHIGAMLGRVFERQRAVTKLSHAEASARQLVESIQAIVWRGNEQYNFTFVSKEAELLLGYPAESWLEDSDFWIQHLHPDDRAWAVSYVMDAAAQKKDHSYDFRMIAHDGRIVWFRNVVRVLVEDGRPNELVGVMIDITRQKESEEQLRRSREQLRALSAHLQYVREEERTRIAREIHDELGQVLTALKMDLSLLNRGLLESSETMPRFKLMEEIGSMRRLVDRTIQTVRRISTELRPEVLDYLDLKAAMEWQIQEFQTRSGIICEFRSNIDAIELDRDRATAMFRIFQEAMTNVARHSNASRVNVGLLKDESSLLMEISDNGRGITESDIAKARSFGLLGIKERALLLGGEVEIKGIPGQGTTLSVRVSVLDENSVGR